MCFVALDWLAKEILYLGAVPAVTDTPLTAAMFIPEENVPPATNVALA